MDKIELKSRYGDIHILEKIEDKKYKFLPSDNYMRCGLTEDKNKYHFVDPSGGPFISVGSILPEVNSKVKDIEFIEGIGTVIIVE
jgi:hypothetical protein